MIVGLVDIHYTRSTVAIAIRIGHMIRIVTTTLIRFVVLHLYILIGRLFVQVFAIVSLGSIV